eukprot:Seg933.9 transcript_id=Seg933.9/GoldUCD/mRNA.D3Y31 product="Serpin B6" protein_id=Seg933.9/GoldUCD/D3Y31
MDSRIVLVLMCFATLCLYVEEREGLSLSQRSRAVDEPNSDVLDGSISLEKTSLVAPNPETEPFPESEWFPEPEPMPEWELFPEPESFPESNVFPEPEPMPEWELFPEPEPFPESNVFPEFGPMPVPGPEKFPEPGRRPGPELNQQIESTKRPTVDAKKLDFFSSLNKFAFDFMKLLPSDGNFFYSPYSVANALAMVFAAVKGTAREEIATAFGWDAGNMKDLHQKFSDLFSNLTAHDGYASFVVANRMWIERREKVQQGFAGTMKKYYASKIGKVNFHGNPKGATKLINSWVAKKTANNIKNIISPGIIQDTTQLVLTNAIYFKAAWKELFNPAKTRFQDFKTAKSGIKRMKMMDNTFKQLPVAFEDDYTAVDLPYEGNRFSMTIVLPNEGKDLASIERKLDFNEFQNLHYYDIEAEVNLPRFEMEESYDLTDILSKLKMKSLFNKDCDLSGMLQTPKGLFFTNALHKSFIKVDEEGTKAAAATSLITHRAAPMEFYANRPFLFFIKDIKSKVIVFAGRFSS